ncbi:Adapter molecule Crk [Orchesella cincta]|uniref:Adapter molecule Crk n=1 Tax=Orchesella cincta TaxID=48709 RepID=A0A1D2N384_ORCCI|nr:Adapter molecule Crk [Orchesella cincta]
MTSGSFDETDFESLYFDGLTFEDAKNILVDEEEGVFLIRASSRGGYVVCVKEDNDVSQYSVNVKEIGGETNFFIREDCPFKHLSSLLSFYKHNKFKTTALKRPVENERVILRRSSTERGIIRSEIPTGHPFQHRHIKGLSAPPDMSSHSQLGGLNPPLYAKVVRAREPNAYDTKWLSLKVDDVIKVVRMKSGIGTGELNGVVGDFPMVNVELLSKPK